jgi:hypothetical protein
MAFQVRSKVLRQIGYARPSRPRNTRGCLPPAATARPEWLPYYPEIIVELT